MVKKYQVQKILKNSKQAGAVRKYTCDYLCFFGGFNELKGTLVISYCGILTSFSLRCCLKAWPSDNPNESDRSRCHPTCRHKNVAM
jgi:hypothetical protein